MNVLYEILAWIYDSILNSRGRYNYISMSLADIPIIKLNYVTTSKYFFFTAKSQPINNTLSMLREDKNITITVNIMAANGLATEAAKAFGSHGIDLVFPKYIHIYRRMAKFLNYICVIRTES